MNSLHTKPLISVITVCYNSEKTISRTVESILSQTYDNYEYWIVDGKSTDNTLEIIGKYKSQFGEKLHVISEYDSGIYNAMNKGIMHCRGEIIGIVNSDDYYSNNALELVAQKYNEEKYPFLIINGEMERVTENDELIIRYRFTDDMVKNKECFGHPAMFAAKTVYNKIGLYDESYKLAADGEWQYRAHEDKEIRYVLIHEVLNHMREGGASDLFAYRWKWFKERSRMRKKYNKGQVTMIYVTEFYKVLKTDIKCLFPKTIINKLYQLKQKKSL